MQYEDIIIGAGYRRDGVRISTAIGYLSSARHHIDLTVRGGVNANR
jgi:hypothetical protein